jgi:hypothetical protein
LLTPSSGRTMKVYEATGMNLPGSMPLATSTTGTITVVGATAKRYDLAIEASSTTGSYSVKATNASYTGSCGAAGTYENPMPLPTAEGSLVTASFEVGAGSPGNGTWAACRSGTACDWYSVSLTAGQRLAVDTYAVTDGLCALEVAIYAPPEHAYFSNAESGGSPTSRAPVTFDVGRSMSSHGANLAYVARGAGTYRIQVRATGTYDCPTHALMAAKGPTALMPGHF